MKTAATTRCSASQPITPTTRSRALRSVLGGGLSACSATHSGVVPLSADKAIERAVNWDVYARENGLPTHAELAAPPDVE